MVDSLLRPAYSHCPQPSTADAIRSDLAPLVSLVPITGRSGDFASPSPQPARMPCPMENRNHNGLVFMKEVEHTVLRESPQPSAAYVGKANGMQKGTVRQGRDHLVSLPNEVFPQARFVARGLRWRGRPDKQRGGAEPRASVRGLSRVAVDHPSLCLGRPARGKHRTTR